MKASVRIVLIVVVAAIGFYGYRQAIKPRLDRNGGTILTYEIAEEAPKVPLETLAEALRQQVDPTGDELVTVHLAGSARVEVRVPRAGDHQAQLQRIRQRVAQGFLPAALKPVSEVYIYPKL